MTESPRMRGLLATFRLLGIQDAAINADGYLSTRAKSLV